MTQFNPQHGLIIIKTRLLGPVGEVLARLALDTGSTSTLISTDLLEIIGYDPTALPHGVQMTIGSGIEMVTRLAIDKVVALNQERDNFSVVAHTLPPTSSVMAYLASTSSAIMF